ncbi:hypothetical protein AgCh_028010 [Apium graveolens]
MRGASTSTRVSFLEGASSMRGASTSTRGITLGRRVFSKRSVYFDKLTSLEGASSLRGAAYLDKVFIFGGRVLSKRSGLSRQGLHPWRARPMSETHPPRQGYSSLEGASSVRDASTSTREIILGGRVLCQRRIHLDKGNRSLRELPLARPLSETHPPRQGKSFFEGATSVLDPWIQERSLEYFKYQNLLTEFLNHAEKCGKAKLINENGEPNISLIKRLFAESDKDRSQHLTTDELEALIRQMESVNLEVDNAYAVNVILERKNSLQVVQPLINKKKEELAKIEHFMARILKKIQSEAIDAGCLLNDDGKPDLDRINSLFDKYDSDKNKVISQLELRSLIQTVKFGDKWITNHDMVVDKVMKDFDDDGDQLITSEEFVRGVTRWLKKATHETKCTDAKRSVEEYDKILWKEVDSMVNEEQVGQKTYKLMLTWGFNKALLQVILGFMMLTYLASPLSRSTRQFSNAVGIPSFFISFVIIPVAMQARKAIAAIFPAAQKNKRTASLTFSEVATLTIFLFIL